MKKNLLFGLFALLMGGQAMAQSQLEMPMNQYQSYACISKVEFNGQTHDSETGVPGVTEWFEDFTGEKTFTIEPGADYELKITFSNFNSGAGDTYHVRAYFDWNNDYELKGDEEINVHHKQITAGPVGGFVPVVFIGKVPASAVTGQPIHMRVYTYFDTPARPYTDPYCDQESGQLEDYLLQIGTSAISNVASASFTVYPNPTEETLFVDADEAGEYMLYSIDGKMVQRGMVMDKAISVAGNQPGMYILKVQTGNEVQQTNIVIK